MSAHSRRARGYSAVTVPHLTGEVVMPAGGKHRTPEVGSLAELVYILRTETPGVTA